MNLNLLKSGLQFALGEGNGAICCKTNSCHLGRLMVLGSAYRVVGARPSPEVTLRSATCEKESIWLTCELPKHLFWMFFLWVLGLLKSNHDALVHRV